MERYETYKDSGVKWIGDIPEEWSTRRIKENCSVIAGATPKSDVHEYWNGDIPWITPADYSETQHYVHGGSRSITKLGLDSCGTTLVPQGSVVVSNRAPIGLVSVTARELCTNQGCKAVIPNGDDISSEYLYWYLLIQDETLNSFGRGTTFLELSTQSLEAFIYPRPPLAEQQAIADYLDAKTAEIDALVADCEREVELLQEYRKAVISEAVTKGLDPDAPMMDSGVKWIGEIPEGWDRGRIAWLRSLPTSYGIIKLGDVPDRDGVPTLRCSDVKEGKLTLTSVRTVYPELSDEYSRTVLKGGEIVINVRGTLGGCAVVPGECRGWNIAREVARIDVRPEFDSRFVMYFLLSNQFWTYLNANLAGSVYQGLNIELLEHAEIVYPNPEQQRAIADCLDAMSAEIDSLIEAKQAMADKLREYRRSLISEAVTGKFKVPGA